MPLLTFLFVFSGAAGLIYESVWARYISLLVGHSAYAQVIVLVIFLGGMAIGSLVVGRMSNRIRSPLLWYAIAEAVIGLFAVRFHVVFVAVTRAAYERWLPSMSPGISATATMWTIAALLILPQSIVLGATFPLMTAGAIRLQPGRDGASLGMLYFANSLGAAIGALVEGFVLIGAVGLDGTLEVAAALNAFVAIGILGFIVWGNGAPVRANPRDGGAGPSTPPRPVVNPSRHFGRILLVVSFATAFSSFFYEIAWTRMLSLVHGSATHSFELMLSAFVLGLALGSLWISRRADQAERPVVMLARLQWAMGVAAIATLPLYVLTFDWTASLLTALKATDGAYQTYSVARYGMTLAVMLPATFCAGTTLPLITRTLLAEGLGEGAIGIVYGVNTIGSILGAALAALLLVPLIGLKWVLITGGLIDIGVGIALFTWIDRSNRVSVWRHRRLWAAVAATAAALVGISMLSPFSPSRLASGVYRYANVPDERLYKYLFYRDGRTASVSVRGETDDSTGLLTISTNGKPDASVSPQWIQPYNDTNPKMILDEDMSTQMFLPLLTLVHAPAARVGAVIGQGSGVTSHILLAAPTLTRLHTIEIEPEMIHGSRMFYPGNRRVFDDPRSTFENDDARAFLATTGPRFDFVLSEPSNPWVSGVSSLFTVEFYERAKSRLQRDGVFVQWFHLYEIDDQTVASVLASIDRVFPSYRVYLSSNSDIVVVAGAAPHLPAPAWSLAASPTMAEDLRHFPPLTLETFEAADVGGRAALHGYLVHARVNSDFRPFLDLNGERLRFRKDFATGFRELAEMRLDIPAAIEHRRRGFGTLDLNPTPEIFRAAALFRGTQFRDLWTTGSIPSTWTDESLRKSGSQFLDFRRMLTQSTPPAVWQTWIGEFIDAESEVHGGTAGVVDQRFYGDVQRYLTAANAPSVVHAIVDFYHGLAAWDFHEVARTAQTITESAQRSWIPQQGLRLGTALAKLELGDSTARSTYRGIPDASLSIPDRVLIGAIETAFTGLANRP